MSRRVRVLAVPLAMAASALAIAGCGGDDGAPTTTTQPAAPTVATQPPGDALLAQQGRIHVDDLGEGWRSAGQAEDPGESACPVAQTADAAGRSHGRSPIASSRTRPRRTRSR